MALFNGMRQRLRGGDSAGRGDQPYPAFKPIAKIPGMPTTRSTSSQGPLPSLPFTPKAQSAKAPAVYSPETLNNADKTIANNVNANRGMKLAPWTGDLTKMPNEDARDEHFAVRNNLDNIDKATKVRDEQMGLLKEKRSQDINNSLKFRIPGNPSSGTR